MLSNAELFEIKIALEGEPREVFPALARAFLSQGHDGPAIRQLTALEAAGSWTKGPVLDEALTELGLHRISKRLAALRLAEDVAKGMLAEPEFSSPARASVLYRLWKISGQLDNLAFAPETPAALDLSTGEPPPPRTQTFRALIAPVQADPAQPKRSLPADGTPRLTFRERWRAARRKDAKLLYWTTGLGLLVLAYLSSVELGWVKPVLDSRFFPIWIGCVPFFVRWFRQGGGGEKLSRAWKRVRRGWPGILRR